MTDEAERCKRWSTARLIISTAVWTTLFWVGVVFGLVWFGGRTGQGPVKPMFEEARDRGMVSLFGIHNSEGVTVTFAIEEVETDSARPVGALMFERQLAPGEAIWVGVRKTKKD